MEIKQTKITITSAEDAADYLVEGSVFIRRRIYPGTVRGLLVDLKNDGHFLSELSFCVNSGCHPYILDGQHRMLAIQKFFEDGNKKPIEIRAVIYYNTTPEERANLYIALSNSNPQKPNDKILILTQANKIFRLITERLPMECGIQIEAKSIPNAKRGFLYSTLLSVYYQAKNGLLEINEYLSAIEQMKRYGDQEYDEIKQAILLFKQIHLEKKGVVSSKRFFGRPYLRVFMYLHINLSEKKGYAVANKIIKDAVDYITEVKRFWTLNSEFKYMRGGDVQTEYLYNLMVKRINRNKLMRGKKLPMMRHIRTKIAFAEVDDDVE